MFTKCSMRWHADRSIYRSLKAASLAEELEGSLRRLGVETIDLYQIHWPDPESEIEEGWETLARLPRTGQNPLDRRFQFFRRANEARAEDCAHHQPAAALLHAATGTLRRRFCRLRRQRHRRDQLFADGFRAADGLHDG